MSKQIIVGIPCYNGWIRAELATFLSECGGAQIEPVLRKPIDVARNHLVHLAQRRNCNLIMVDSDCAPAPGSFAALSAKVSDEECVASVPYLSYNGNIGVGETSPQFRDVEHLEGWQPTDNCSTHLVAYHINVFHRIQPPYFVQKYNAGHTSLAGPAEDTILHRRLRDVTVPIYVNWSLWAAHVCDRVLEKPRSLTDSEKFLVMAGLQ